MNGVMGIYLRQQVDGQVRILASTALMGRHYQDSSFYIVAVATGQKR